MGKRLIGTVCAAAVFLMLSCSIAVCEPLNLELVKTKVDAATSLIEERGEEVFNILRDKNSDFWFGDGKGYIFVNSTNGTNLVHPAKPSLEGKYLLDLKDVNGVYFFMQFNEIAERYGRGWVSYYWPKPGAKEASPKISYVRMASYGGKKYVVGSGMYDATIAQVREKYPNDPVYEEDAF